MGSREEEVQRPYLYQLSPVDHCAPRMHAPKVLYFATNESPSDITKTLQDALHNSVAALPILCGTVGLMEGAAQTGTLAVQAPLYTSSQILSVKDLRKEYDYDFASIAQRNFPPDAVDVKVVSPDVEANPSRVMLAQANIIKGGVVLVLAMHHCVVDETGIFDVVKLWSTFCSGGNGYTLVKPEWTARTPLMKGEGTGNLKDHVEFNLLPPEKSATHSTKSTEYLSKSSDTSTGSAILFFSDASLEKLKKAATAESGDESSWISTNDALVALLWSRITSIRRFRGMGDVTYSCFFMAVNGRSRLQPPIHADYMGNVAFLSIAALGLDSLTSPDAKLSDIAQTVRKSVDAVDNKTMKDKIKAVSDVDDIGRLAPGGYDSQGKNLACTSWYQQLYYSLNWGNVLGGKCKRVRWRSSISDGVFVVFPKLPSDLSDFGEGGMEVYLGFKKDHMQILRSDKLLNEFAAWRCIA